MDLLEHFEEYLRTHPIQIDSFHPHYQEALNAMLQADGKRFRPLLLLSIVHAVDPLLLPSSMPIALAVEIFHTYSLIHDDLPVMDDAALRRGKPTLHTRYDELTAVLVGDALNTHAFYLIGSAPLSSDIKNGLTTILAKNGGVDGMVHGQILDCHFENHPLTLKQLTILHRNKTAKLIAASLQMGGVIVGFEEMILQRLYDFGLGLGLLFQIQDDIIDAVCTQEEAGKSTQKDKYKNSFVNLLGLDGAYTKAQELAKNLEEELASFEPRIQKSLQEALQNYLYRHQHFTKESNAREEDAQKDG